MKKYIVSLFIVFCLLLSLFPMSIYANVSQEDKIDTVKMVGFMQGDEEGNLNLDKNVTRAEFVTMTVRASSYKDSVGMGNDVKSSHWASEFVQIAVQEGWVSGYTDGSFRPNNMITLEEACTVLLNMLGYDSSTLVGSFPDAQLNKASSIGLRDDLLVSKGSLMTRMDCVELFYNLLLSKNSNGKLYGEVLGYKIVDDKVDLDSLILDDMKGPYIATDKTDLNFKIKNIYKDNEKVDSYNLNQYDVYYYNKDAEILWVYTDKVAGKITSLGPNSTEPTSIMIAGNTYNINNSDVKHQLSILGDGDLTGEVVTLLFGMNNDVVGIITGEDVETTYYGVVQKSSKELFTEDNAHIETVVTVACTDGVVRTFSTDRDVKY